MISNKLWRDAEHIYRLGDDIIPGVSEILQNVGLKTFYRQDAGFQKILEGYAERGKIVHDIAAIFDRGEEPDWKTVPAGVIGYAEAYRKFRDEYRFKAKLIEQYVYSEKFWFAGQFDRFGTINRKLYLIDTKTGNGGMEKSYRWQTAGYLIALKEKDYEHADIQRMIVKLYSNGDYKPFLLSNPENRHDEMIFRSAAITYNANRGRYDS